MPTTNKGTLFWLAFPGNVPVSPNAELYILADTVTNFTVEIPGQGFLATDTAAPGSPGIVALPEGLAAIQTSEVVEGRGIRVTADRPVTVVLRSPVPPSASDDSYLGLPVHLLGTEYYVALGYQENTSLRDVAPRPSQLTLAATEDDTNVTVIPSCESVDGSPPGVPINLTLNQGQTWQYRCIEQGDVTGSQVRADKPLSVFAGSQCADVPNRTPSCDYLVEQIIPLNLWGREYLVPPLQNNTSNLVRVLAQADNTTITVDDGATPVTTTIDEGQFYEALFDVAVRITSDENVLVGQYGAGERHPPADRNRDPFFLQIFHNDLFAAHHRFFSPDGYDNLVNIVAPNGANVELDGMPVAGFAPVPGSNHQWATVSLAVGEHTLDSNLPIMAYAYGLRTVGAYGNPTGLSVTVTPPPQPPPDPRFRHHTIKTLKVLCKESVQVTDTLQVGLVGVPEGPIVNVAVEVVGFTATVFEEKVFNLWTLHVTATDAAGMQFAATNVPFREETVHCPVNLTQWPGDVVTQNHDVEGPIVVGPVDLPEGLSPTITFTILLRYCLVATKEVRLKIDGAIPSC